MRIVDLCNEDDGVVEQVATLLMGGVFAHQSHTWTDKTTALDEIGESFEANHISRVGFDDSGKLLGWAAGYSIYNGYIWQVYPLALTAFNLDIGHRLLQDFEEQVRAHGGLGILLSIDVELTLPTLHEKDLSTDPWQHIISLQHLDNHRIEFFRQLGFAIVGIIPNAQGRGKPNILLERSVAR